MGWVRALGFAVLCLLVYVISSTVNLMYLIASHMTVYSYDLDWVLLNPRLAIQIVLTELTRSPLLLSSVILFSIILGSVADWVLRILGKRRSLKYGRGS